MRELGPNDCALSARSTDQLRVGSDERQPSRDHLEEHHSQASNTCSIGKDHIYFCICRVRKTISWMVVLRQMSDIYVKEYESGKLFG